MITRKICAIPILTAAACLLSAAHPGAHEPEVAAQSAVSAAVVDSATPVGTVTAFHSALARGDTAMALELMAEEALIFESGGVERSRAEYASHHLTADAAFSAAMTRTLVDRTSGGGGDSAWVTSIETVTGTWRGRAINSRSLETMVLRRINGHWRITHIHWSSADLARAS
jgi:ketosteroid isomerase-like protein